MHVEGRLTDKKIIRNVFSNKYIRWLINEQVQIAKILVVKTTV